MNITLTSADEWEIDVRDLPAKDFPYLAKFKKLRQISFYSPKGTGGTDEKLIALSIQTFTSLQNVDLLNCPLVTDEGIAALTNLPSIKGFQLEGTSITDAACETMATKMRLDGVNVANCTNITINGLMKLIQSETINEISFSSDNLTGDDVMRLIDAFKRINWCEIVDQKAKLDAKAVAEKAKQRGIKIFVRPDGALQDVRTN
ncbi:MAG TPA: hypothetical protein DCQ92_15005 [Verrucomicrobia subdivision 3 bacterium]|nr:hypothetical protein [Limisphaerales bacterium]